jgi:hypothetical protein
MFCEIFPLCAEADRRQGLSRQNAFFAAMTIPQHVVENTGYQAPDNPNTASRGGTFWQQNLRHLECYWLPSFLETSCRD